VNARTAATLAEPDAVTPGSTDLSFYPLLYWPITGQASALSDAQAQALNDYMARGGILLIDTRDSGSGEGFAPGANTALRRIAHGLNIPALAPLTVDHVLARAFYLLRDYPGRYEGGTVWVQRGEDRANDGVSPVVIGGNDWAAAWAVDPEGNNPFAVIPGGARQRLLAYRFGVNLVMYALTGNYKGDQVHIPAQAQEAIAAIRFDPLVPQAALWALVAIALAVLAVGAFKRARGTAFRALAFLCLLLWLAGPRLTEESRMGLSDIGLLVVDQTASMQVGKRAQITESARQEVEKEARGVPDLQLRTVTVPEGGSGGTRLFDAVNRALADIPRERFAGTIAITDGQVHDIPSKVPGGEPLNVLLPATGEQIDRTLRVLEAPTYGIVGKPVVLKIVVEDLGVKRPAATAQLRIEREGVPPESEDVRIGVPTPIEVPITRPGPTIVRLAVNELPGEVSKINDSAVVQINGIRDRLRVLLISGEPNPGERTWRRLLKSDPAVDLVHFTILRPPEKDDLTPLNELSLIAFPVRELFQDKINQFDLIILDRFQNRGLLPLPYLANIANYVRDGGALLLSVGPEFAGPGTLASTPLAAVLPAVPAQAAPVVDGAFRPRLSDLGRRHPVTDDLSGANPPGDPAGRPIWGSWYQRIEPADVRGETLMTSPGGDPLLILDHEGKGRVALLLSDQIWLWSRGHQGGGPQGELLRRVAHWLMKEPDLEANALTARISDGRLQVERRSIDPGAPPPVTVTAPSGTVSKLNLIQAAPGRAAAEMVATAPGVWKVTDGVHTIEAASTMANPQEFEDLRATATRLRPLAQDSGGGVHWLGERSSPDVPELRRTEADRPASGDGWMGLARRHDYVVTGVSSVPLLPAWAALPLLLGLLIIAWRREGA
jgi:hypothetical protein